MQCARAISAAASVGARASLRLRPVGARSASHAAAHGHGAEHHHDAAHGAAGDHHHASPAAAAYEAQVPTLFGEPVRAHGEKRPREDWEGSFFLLLAGSAVVVALGSMKPNSNVRDWARDEAAERMRRVENGQAVEMGVNYAGIRMLKEKGAISEDVAEALEAGAVPVSAYPRVA